MAHKIALAASAAMTAILLTASPAAACSYGAASFESIAAEARVIFVGRVISADADTGEYVLRVDRLLRGSASDRLQLEGFGAPNPSSCDPRLTDGARYVFGLEPDEPLHLREVWFRVRDGLLSPEFFKPPVATVSELALVLASTPDTGTAAPIAPGRISVLTTTGLALLMAAAFMAAALMAAVLPRRRAMA